MYMFVFSAMKAGCKSPLLVVPPGYPFKQAWLVSVLGVMHGLYCVSAFVVS